MKILLTLALLLSSIAYSEMPFVSKELSDAFDQKIVGQKVKQMARAEWDFAVNGGAISAIGLGVYLPAKAIVDQSYIYVKTQVVDGGTGTGALHCEDANNLYTATDVTGSAAGAVILGIPSKGSSLLAAIASQCQLTWTITGSAATAGNLLFFVEYSVGE